ncbi:hypothetical protein MCGE09_00568 [Thaumarchaeota archaeon SCGC AB-539-E09]|nr:hypothetical protein MCGE09_00568 [Thaumarchaeota archaeon SCGC AB-539-E09]
MYRTNGDSTEIIGKKVFCNLYIVMLVIILTSYLFLGCRVLSDPSYTVNQITDNSYDDAAPNIHYGQLVWHSYEGSYYQIYMYDYATDSISQITSGCSYLKARNNQ